MIKKTKIFAFLFMFLFLIGFYLTQIKAEEESIYMAPGASIRTTDPQGLKFSATFDDSILTALGDGDIRGFFIMYGVATIADLEAASHEEHPELVLINGKSIKRESNYDKTTAKISVVLTGIPIIGYAQPITVIGFAQISDVYTFVPTVVTRSIAEVALNAAKVGDSDLVSGVLTELEANYYTHQMDEFNNYRISSLYETDRVKLRTKFIDDWNSMFLTTWTSIDGPTFHANAQVGATSSWNLSGSHIKQFFNDSIMSEKWTWLLTYLQNVVVNVDINQQVLAIQYGGTYAGNNLYLANQLCYSITNFFNNTYEQNILSAIDFTINTRYEQIVTYNQAIFVENETSNLVYKGNTFILPESNAIKGYTILELVDGIDSYNPGDSYVTNGYVVFSTDKMINQYTMSFESNDGSYVTDINQDYATLINAPDDPSKTNYTFDGWYSDQTFLDIYVFTTMPAEDLTLYAKWLESTDGLFFELTNDEESYAVTSYLGSETNIVIPSRYRGKCVTDIGEYTFANYGDIVSIAFPSTITHIDTNVCYGCTSLASIIMDSNNSTYKSEQDCLIEHATNTLIMGCSESIIPNSVTSIGNFAFAGCYGLTSFNIPNGVTSIGSNAFYNCIALTSITLPSSLTTIAERAFYVCTSLESITLPDSVTSISSETFSNCTSLVSATFSLGLTNIDGFAFSFCRSLASVTIPSSVTNIEENAFYICSNLMIIVVHPDNLIYRSEQNCLIERATNALIIGCGSSVIPNSVTSIKSSAFAGCSNLASITIPSGVTSIGNSAFMNCDNLTSITILGSITSIEEATFAGCEKLESIVLPNSVTSIGYIAFVACYSLTEILIPSGVTYIDAYAFGDCILLTIYCEAPEQPITWHLNWNDSNCPVVWNYNLFTISFNSNGGSSVIYITQYRTTTITKPLNPTKENYVFEGWYSDETLLETYIFSTMPDQNIILYAKWLSD